MEQPGAPARTKQRHKQAYIKKKRDVSVFLCGASVNVSRLEG